MTLGHADDLQPLSGQCPEGQRSQTMTSGTSSHSRNGIGTLGIDNPLSNLEKIPGGAAPIVPAVAAAPVV